jgi:hypothetical protein
LSGLAKALKEAPPATNPEPQDDKALKLSKPEQPANLKPAKPDDASIAYAPTCQ